MNLVELNHQFDTEDKCRELFKRLRLPENVTCPRCKSRTISKLAKQQKFECSDCRYQFSVTAGTIFNDSHLPLTTWFMATLLLCEAKKGISPPVRFKRTLGIGVIRQHGISATESAPRCVKLISRCSTAKSKWTKPTSAAGSGKGIGSGKANKEVVIGIRQRNGDLRIVPRQRRKAGTLAQFIRENVSEDVDVIITDDFASYPFAMKQAGVKPREAQVH